MIFKLKILSKQTWVLGFTMLSIFQERKEIHILILFLYILENMR